MKIENEGPKIEYKDLATIETELDAELSSEYREFLLRYNGGVPTPDAVDVPNAPGMPTDVQIFFGIRRSPETSNLLWNLSLISDRCPNFHVLPIACDSGGNLFCVKVGRGVAAEVVYCDLRSPECTFYTVAPTFGKFLSSLRSYRH
jgi:hypothetical protein